MALPMALRLPGVSRSPLGADALSVLPRGERGLLARLGVGGLSDRRDGGRDGHAAGSKDDGGWDARPTGEGGRDAHPTGEVYVVVRTGTRVDVGWWFVRRRVWLAVVEDALVLLAHGARPIGERVAFCDLQQSIYNHVTGKLVLAPARAATVRQLRLPMEKAQEVLAHVYSKGFDHA